MKTFETEKHNIPEGATHYADETHEDFFAWIKFIGGKQCRIMPSSKLFNTWIVKDTKGIKPIPQTNIETPEEKEALDSINSNLIKPREPSKPVITKVEWGGAGLPAVGSLCKVNRDSYAYRVMYSSKYVVIVQNLDNDNTTAHGMDIVLDLHKGNYTFSKLETEAERVERERVNAIVEMASIAIGPEFDLAINDRIKDICSKIHDAGYRKGSE